MDSFVLNPKKMKTNMFNFFSWHYWWEDNRTTTDYKFEWKNQINHSLFVFLKVDMTSCLSMLHSFLFSISITGFTIQAQRSLKSNLMKNLRRQRDDLLSNNSNLTYTATQSEVCSICVTSFPETDKPNHMAYSCFLKQHLTKSMVNN